MIAQIRWVERRFTFDLPIGAFPAVLERLRGTPARAAELFAAASEQQLSARVNDKWSAKEHIGHLADSVALEEKRLGEFLAGASALSPADMTNRQTEDANHNQAPSRDLLEGFRRHRLAFVDGLESLSESDVSRTAIHPRLQQPMRVLDFAYFLAEHDDHHLAAARRTLRSIGG